MNLAPMFVMLAALPILGAFFWLWWSMPRDRVPPHLTNEELKHLVTEDQLRRTSYQILIALALLVTFILAITQLSISTGQWSSDYQFRARQDRFSQFTDGLRALGQSDEPARLAGVLTLYSIATQNPEDFFYQASEVLTAFLKQNARADRVNDAAECREDDSGEKPRFEDRDEPLPSVQAALSSLGDSKFASYRLISRSSQCVAGKMGYIPGSFLRLDHLFLDGLDLSRTDLSCVEMSQTRLRRTVFTKATLRGTDFRGVRAADWMVPSSPAQLGTIGDRAYDDEKTRPWQRYRCWATDFSETDLRDSNFEGAYLGGANFSGANLTGANFCRADVSRANFRGARGLNTALRNACAGNSSYVDKDAQPLFSSGAGFVIPSCVPERICD